MEVGELGDSVLEGYSDIRGSLEEGKEKLGASRLVILVERMQKEYTRRAGLRCRLGNVMWDLRLRPRSLNRI